MKDMKKNMGNNDRFIRLTVAALLIILFFANVISGTLGIVALIAAGIFIATSLVNFCPMYAILGISTCKVK